MITKGASQQAFEVERVDFHAPEAGGYLGGVQAGFPLWMGEWTIGRLGAAGSDDWRAWVASMRGAQKRFLGRDLARPYPKLHIDGFAGMTRAGGGVFDGSATSWSQSIDSAGNALLTLGGLPVALSLSKIDYIGFRWDAGGAPAGSYWRRALVRVTEGAIANGSGNVTVTVEPPVPTAVVPVGAIAHLDYPACVMSLLPDTKLGAIDRRLAVTGGKILGLQDLRP